jgi:cation diffusion facilitator family transporter
MAIGAALLGLLANGAIGTYKIRIGKKIGSPPLVADGKHALTDALASVVAFGGLIGVRMGWPQADPIAALVVVLAIAAVGVDAGRNVLTRLIDAVDPKIIEDIEHCAVQTGGVVDVGRIQARWAGRSLYVTLTVAVDPSMPVSKAHDIAEAIHHHILHDVPGVAQVDVHVDPGEAHGGDAHRRTTAHDEARD